MRALPAGHRSRWRREVGRLNNACGLGPGHCALWAGDIRPSEAGGQTIREQAFVFSLRGYPVFPGQ
jgi:hypothetical protein